LAQTPLEQSLPQAHVAPAQTDAHTPPWHEPLEQLSLTVQADPPQTVSQSLRPRSGWATHILERQSALVAQAFPAERLRPASARPNPAAATTPPSAAPMAPFKTERREVPAIDLVNRSNLA
jgi:hypothetical protein